MKMSINDSFEGIAYYLDGLWYTELPNGMRVNVENGTSLHPNLFVSRDNNRLCVFTYTGRFQAKFEKFYRQGS